MRIPPLYIGIGLFVMGTTIMHASNSQDPPTVILDGATNPELISDQKAYEVFFQASNVSPEASDIRKAITRDKFSRAALHDADVAVVMEVLVHFNVGVAALSHRLDALRNQGANGTEYKALDTAFQDLVCRRDNAWTQR